MPFRSFVKALVRPLAAVVLAARTRGQGHREGAVCLLAAAQLCGLALGFTARTSLGGCAFPPYPQVAAQLSDPFGQALGRVPDLFVETAASDRGLLLPLPRLRCDQPGGLEALRR